MLTFENLLYILDTVLSPVWRLQIFPPNFPFNFLNMVDCKTKMFILMNSNLSNLFFMDVAFGNDSFTVFVSCIVTKIFLYFFKISLYLSFKLIIYLSAEDVGFGARHISL